MDSARFDVTFLLLELNHSNKEPGEKRTLVIYDEIKRFARRLPKTQTPRPIAANYGAPSQNCGIALLWRFKRGGNCGTPENPFEDCEARVGPG